MSDNRHLVVRRKLDRANEAARLYCSIASRFKNEGAAVLEVLVAAMQQDCVRHAGTVSGIRALHCVVRELYSFGACALTHMTSHYPANRPGDVTDRKPTPENRSGIKMDDEC